MTSLFHKHDVNPIGPDIPMNAKILAKFPLAIIRRYYPELPYINVIFQLNEVRPAPSGFEWTHSHNAEGRSWFQLAAKPSDCDECNDGVFLHGSHEYECDDCDGLGVVFDDPIVQVKVGFDGQILEIIMEPVSI